MHAPARCVLDLAEQLDLIEQHIPCLERIAAEAKTPGERVAAALELAVWRLAADLAAHDRTMSNGSGMTRSVPEALPTHRTDVRDA